ncbi:ATP-grasp domain-containing protein [Bizionia sp.]|uniref:ATP-grasp domain-containing protein n=1 Tax=Bizionia sp. TaxID=1954480 RepID=UPI003A8FE8BA
MKTFDIVKLTDKRYLEDSETNTYKHNVFYEDFLVQEALQAENLKVTRLAWDDLNFNWSDTKAVLFRTTWDYFDRFSEFSKWLSMVSTKTRLLNSEKIIRWNIDKHYLLELNANGIHVAKSFFIETGTQSTLTELNQQLNWQETVLKPCVSGAGRHTYRLTPHNIAEHEAIFTELIQQESMMLQPFQHNIVTQGEMSLIIFNGEYSHAVLKQAKAGDFRVQDDFGGSVIPYAPTETEIAFAINATKACPELPIYARVDIFTDNTNQLAVSELELIEPELWFRKDSKAAKILAKHISLCLK